MLLSPGESVLGPGGCVLWFSRFDFQALIARQDRCFMCGRLRDGLAFTREHVLPDWILRRYSLHDVPIRLPNQTGIQYGKYTVPFCDDCNGALGEILEQPIREAAVAGFDRFVQFVRTEGRERLFLWLALIFFKTHLRDLSLRASQDRRQDAGNIGDIYDWDSLHHIHCLARAPIVGARLLHGVIGSISILHAAKIGNLGRFDYADLYAAKTALIQIDDIVVLAVLNDSCMAQTFFERDLNPIRGSITPIQSRELLARLAYINLRIKPRPIFYTSCDASSRPLICVNLPDGYEAHPGSAAEFGSLFAEVAKDALKGVVNADEMMEQVRTGCFSFISDAAGAFNERSMVPQDGTNGD